MLRREQSKIIGILLMMICVISLLVIAICANKNVKDEIAHTLPRPIVGATGITGEVVGTNVAADFNSDTGKIMIYIIDEELEGGTLDTEEFKRFTEKCGVSNIKTIEFSNMVDLQADVTGLFQGLTELISVEKAYNMNMSNVTVATSMFSHCTNLTTIDVSSWDMRKVETLYMTFQNCTSLTTLDVSEWETVSVTNMSATFDTCKNLTELDVSNWNTSKVTTMSYMFHVCTKLTTIDLSKWDTSKLTNMSYMFAMKFNDVNVNNELTSIDVSGLNTENVLDMAFLFANCNKLTEIDVSRWDTSNVTNFYGIFMSCNSLTEIDVSGWITGNVTNMGTMFWDCNKLTSIDVGGFGWDTSNVTSMYGMFWNCNKLTSLDVGNWNTGRVKNMLITFEHCNQLRDLDVSGWDMRSVETLRQTFNNCYNLTLDTRNWRTDRVTNLDRTFGNCYSLTELDTSNWNASNVTTIKDMFAGCSHVETVDMSNWYATEVIDISGAFWNCKALKKLDLRNFDFSKIEKTESKVQDNFLQGCVNLNEIYLSEYTSSVVIPLPKAYRNAYTPENTEASYTEINSTLCAEPTHLFAGSLISFDLGMGKDYMTPEELLVYAEAQCCITGEELDTGGTEGKGRDILPVTAYNYSDTIGRASILWDENKLESEKGYKFKGWLTNHDNSIVGVPYASSAFTKDITYTAIFVPKEVNYTVNHYQQNLSGNAELHDDENYTLIETDNLQALTDTNVIPSRKNYAGFSAPIGIEITIKGNGTSVVDYYYTRNSYILTLAKGTGIESVSGANTYLYGQSITIDATLKEDTAENTYEWNKWTADTLFEENGNIISEIEEQNHTFQMPAKNITLTANGRDTKNLYLQTIEVRYENGDGTFTEYEILEREEYEYGEQVNWSLEETDTYEAVGIESYTVTEAKTTSVTIYRKKYTITLNKGAGINNITILPDDEEANITDDGNTITATYRCGQNITINADIAQGYRWLDWKNGGDEISTKEYTFEMPTRNTIYVANASPNEGVSYTVNHWQQKLNGRVELHDDENYTLTETEDLRGITDVTVIPETKIYTGFITPEKKEVTILGDGSAVVDYYYERRQYDVILEKDKGITAVRGAGKYYYEQEVNIEAELNEDYIWGNWTGTGTLNNINTRFKMPAENVTLRANSKKITRIEVYYIDETNNEIIAETRIIDGYAGEEYEVKSVQINGYKYSSSSENATGIMTEEPIRIYFKYLKETGLNIKYVDINTKEELAEAKHYDVISTERYDVTEDYKDIESYTFVKDSGNTKGIMINEGTDVVYYYAYNSRITIKYYDMHTGKEIDYKQELEGYEGKEYELEPKELNGYKFIKIDNPKGKMEREETEVKYFYAKKIKITIKYLYNGTKEELKEKKEYIYCVGDKYNFEEEKENFGEYKYIDANVSLKGDIGQEDIEIEIYYEIDNTTIDVELPQTGEVMIMLSPLIIVIFINIVILFINLAKFRKYHFGT